MNCELTPVRLRIEGHRASYEAVFSAEETEFYLYPDGWKWRSLEEPPRNPAYREDLSLRATALHLGYVLQELGYEFVAGGVSIPINEFLAVATQWLQRNIDRRIAQVHCELSARLHGAMAARGSGDESVNERILKAATIAREGRRRGATHVFVG